MIYAYNPLIEVISAAKKEDVNATLLLERHFISDEPEAKKQHLSDVASACKKVTNEILEAIHIRRVAAVAASLPSGHAIATIGLTPYWRLIIGGEKTASETSLAMSKIYGVPIIPATALKGVAAAYANADGRYSVDEIATIFGGPRPGNSDAEARRGAVNWFDGVPLTTPVVVIDTLTPHVKEYYDAGNRNQFGNVFPAEYHNPVPIRFLAVESTTFRTVLSGPSDIVDRAQQLLREAVDYLGIGSKTNAGYGYCDAHLVEEP